MAHGSTCGCGLCKLGKKMGMIKQAPEAKTECKCGDQTGGHEDKDCCKKEAK